MASPNDVPRISEPIAGQGGYLTQAWLNFFMKLASQQSGAELEAQIQALEQLVQQIQQAQDTNLQINGPLSVEVQGIPANGVVTLTLKGDTAAPGNTYVYGTGPTGGKGWYPLADAIAAVSGQLVKTVAGNGVTSLGLAPAVIASLGKADSAVQSIVAGTGVTVDNADPRNPIVSATGGGGGAVSSVNARTGAVVVPDFVQKATAPVSADFGRAIIDGDRWFNTTNGVDYTWVAGAWVHDNAASLSRYMPAYLANGAASPVPLNADGSVPAYLANGTYSPFATQA